MPTLNSKDFGLKIYNKFPPKYREDDALQNHALKRYLQALSDGGFKHTIDEINGLVGLIDPNNIDASLLPTLFKHYGLELFNGIPEQYLRYLLPRLGEAWSKKGSLDVVEFITSSLSGIKTSTRVVYDEKGNSAIDVKFEMDYNLGDYYPKTEQFKRLLKHFVPFYCDILMIYSYVFYESKVLKIREDSFVSMTDTKEENASFQIMTRGTPNSALLGESLLGNLIFGNNKEAITFNDRVKQKLSEQTSLSASLDTEIYHIKLAVVSEYCKAKTKDSILDLIKLSCGEGGIINSAKDSIEDIVTQILGESVNLSTQDNLYKQFIITAVIDELISLETSDSRSDNIKLTQSDSGSIQPNDDNTNNKVIQVAEDTLNMSMEFDIYKQHILASVLEDFITLEISDYGSDDAIRELCNEDNIVNSTDDTINDTIISFVSDDSKISTQYLEDLNVNIAPLNDGGLIDGSGKQTEIITQQLSESGGFKSINIDIPNMAVLSLSLLGDAILDTVKRVDEFEDNIRCVDATEKIIFHQNVDTLTNRGYNTLNGNFFTNGLHSYDVITIGGERIIEFS